MSATGSKIAALRADRRGNFAVATAAIASALLISTGYAINTAQLYNVKSNLSQALDAAITSTARDLTIGRIQPEDARRTVEAFLRANGDSKFARSDDIILSNLAVNKTTKTVEAAAYVDVDVMFPMFGIANRQRVAASSTALYSDKLIEIVMMLDITGSMSGQKIKDLRTAATNAVTRLLTGQNAAAPRVRIALVPFADAVNAGPLAKTVDVEKTYTPLELEPPPLDQLPVVGDILRPDDCATERKGSQQFSDAAPGIASVNRDYRLKYCPDAPLQPLSADMAALTRAIGGLKAEGVTSGHIGIQWSWYMLSPEWKGVMPKSSAPASYKDDKAAKYAILMTDGEFNTAFAGVGKDERTQTSQSSRSRKYADRLCREMKKAGITLFTIGFKLEEKNAKDTMKACASPDEGGIRHYFETGTGAELDAAYQAIATNIERLVIVK